MNDTPARAKEIAFQQVLCEDSSVYSSQWMTIPVRRAEAVTPEALLERYLAHVRHFTLSMVRPERSAEGIDFRLIATKLNLLSFNAPLFGGEQDSRSVTLRINGGYLVQPEECGRGELSFITEPLGDQIRIMVRLADYCPLLLGGRKPSRWRKLLYRLTQALLHKIVTVRFLVRLYHELEGRGRHVRVVRAKGPVGEDI